MSNSPWSHSFTTCDLLVCFPHTHLCQEEKGQCCLIIHHWRAHRVCMIFKSSCSASLGLFIFSNPPYIGTMRMGSLSIHGCASFYMYRGKATKPWSSAQKPHPITHTIKTVKLSIDWACIYISQVTVVSLASPLHTYHLSANPSTPGALINTPSEFIRKKGNFISN